MLHKRNNIFAVKGLFIAENANGFKVLVAAENIADALDIVHTKADDTYLHNITVRPFENSVDQFDYLNCLMKGTTGVAKIPTTSETTVEFTDEYTKREAAYTITAPIGKDRLDKLVLECIDLAYSKDDLIKDGDIAKIPSEIKAQLIKKQKKIKELRGSSYYAFLEDLFTLMEFSFLNEAPKECTFKQLW